MADDTSPPPDDSSNPTPPDFSPQATGDSGDMGAIDADPAAPEGPGATATESNKPPAQREEEGYDEAVANIHARQAERMRYHAEQQQKFVDKFEAERVAQIAPPVFEGKPVNPTAQGQQQAMQVAGMSQADKNHMGQSVFGMLATTALAMVLFGTNRNPYARGAIMQGLGQAFTNFSKGRVEDAKHKMADWHELTEKIGQENKERLNNYKAVLANKKMNLAQQMQVMGMYAKIYKDKDMADNADAKNLNGVLKSLHNRVKGQERWNKETLGFLSPKAASQYRQKILENTKGKVDIERSPEERQWAMDHYPPSQIMRDDIRQRAEATAEGKADAKKKAQGGGTDSSGDLFDLKGQ